MSDAIFLAVILWAIVAFITGLARLDEMEDSESAASIAAGVLWPIYLPYRLVILIWSGKP